ESMDEAINALRAHFLRDGTLFLSDTLLEGAFNSLMKLLQYVTAVRDLAATCEFGSNLDEIRDQLAENIANHHIRERLLLEPELTLQKAITLATQIEAAREQARIIAGENSASVQAVSADATAFSCQRRNSAPPKHVPAPTLSHPPARAVSACPVSN
ncbi:hypothetical protein GOODEAATRI_026378, partial [Goodea atripinnis]